MEIRIDALQEVINQLPPADDYPYNQYLMLCIQDDPWQPNELTFNKVHNYNTKIKSRYTWALVKITDGHGS